MGITRRTNQGGSIVTFIIVGLVLTLLLAGAAYYVNQRGEQARKDQAIANSDEKINDEEVAVDDSSDNEAVIHGDTTVDESDENQNLPETGMEIAFSELVGAFLLTASTTSYANSRRRATAHL
jgi:hypothetical protein